MSIKFYDSEERSTDYISTIKLELPDSVTVKIQDLLDGGFDLVNIKWIGKNMSKFRKFFYMVHSNSPHIQLIFKKNNKHVNWKVRSEYKEMGDVII